MDLVGCKTLSHATIERDLVRRDFGYALIVAQEKVRNYFSEAKKVYDSKYLIVVG